jgi:hypothetical protein
LDNGAHVDSLSKDGNTPLFCAAERFSTSCAKVKEEFSRVINLFLLISFYLNMVRI